MTNLTPAQLEQFESTFRYFDKDETNTLNQFEMSAALASLGIVYSVGFICACCVRLLADRSQDEDMDIIYDQLMLDYGAVTFEAFINLLVYRCFSSASEASVHKGLRLTSWRTRHRLRSCGNPSGVLQGTRQASSHAVLLNQCLNFSSSQPYVTELDLRVAHLPATAIEFLRQAMPSSSNGVGESEYDYERWLDEVFEQDGQ